MDNEACAHCGQHTPGAMAKGNECIECIHSFKVCPLCNTSRQLQEFYKSGNTESPRQKICKHCSGKRAKIVEQYRSYLEDLYVYLKGRVDTEGFEHPLSQVDELYRLSRKWLTKRSTVFSQFLRERAMLMPLMHLLDDFGEKTHTCSKCKEKLPTGDFYKNKRHMSGLARRCKKCLKDYRESAIIIDEPNQDGDRS